MGLKTVTLEIPDELYQSVQEAADATDRSLEAIVLGSLELLFKKPSPLSNLESLLNALSAYSTPELWAVVYRQLPWSQSARLRELSAKRNQAMLAEIESAELDQLVDLVDRYTLLRSEALMRLKERGEDISTYLKMGA